VGFIKELVRKAREEWTKKHTRCEQTWVRRILPGKWLNLL